VGGMTVTVHPDNETWGTSTRLRGDTFTILMVTAMLTASLTYTWVCMLFHGISCLEVMFSIPCSCPLLMSYSKAKQKAQTVASLRPTTGHLSACQMLKFWPNKKKTKSGTSRKLIILRNLCMTALVWKHRDNNTLVSFKSTVKLDVK
jgi:hypothetical protein